MLFIMRVSRPCGGLGGTVRGREHEHQAEELNCPGVCGGLGTVRHKSSEMEMKISGRGEEIVWKLSKDGKRIFLKSGERVRRLAVEISFVMNESHYCCERALRESWREKDVPLILSGAYCDPDVGPGY
jgi:hypothetical protein